MAARLPYGGALTPGGVVVIVLVAWKLDVAAGRAGKGLTVIFILYIL